MGMKTKISASVDIDVLERAKKRGINVSGILNQALSKSTGQDIDSAEADIVCAKCGKFQELASQHNAFKGMVWLCPDELWICTNCMGGEIRQVTIGVAS